MKIQEIQRKLNINYNEAKKFKEQAELLGLFNVIRGCSNCLFSGNGKHSCNRFMVYAKFKVNCKELGLGCDNENDHKHFIPFYNYG